MNDVERIDLSEWTQSGGGALGVSYTHRTNPDLMLKMSLGEVPLGDWEREIENARIFVDLGLPTPRPGSIVTDGKHYGIVFQRIRNKISYAAAVGQCGNDGEIEALGVSFADTVRLMHSTRGEGSGLQNVKDSYRKAIGINTFRSESQKEAALKLLEGLPDGNSVLHGDLHFGNVIIADGKDYLIDIGNASYGDPRFDLAMFAGIIHLHKAGMLDLFTRIYHCDFSQCLCFYQAYIDSLMGCHTGIDDLEAELAPYLVLRLIDIENVSGKRYFPAFDQLMKEMLPSDPAGPVLCPAL